MSNLNAVTGALDDEAAAVVVAQPEKGGGEDWGVLELDLVLTL